MCNISFSKCAWVKKFKIVLNVFIETVIESNKKSNRLWVDQRKRLYI